MHLDMQELHQQPRHTTPRMRNNRIHTNRKESGDRRNTTKKIAIRPTHRKIKTKAISQPTPLDGRLTLKANGT
jgi:hypothetical protein